jgi:integrase
MPEAVAAFRLLHRYDGWGPFSRGSLRKALHLACVTAKVPLIRPYDLRHSFGTAVYEATGDIASAQALLDHSDVKQTRRYTMKAVAGRMRKALNQTRKSFQ